MTKPRPDALTQATRLLAATDKTRAQLLAALASRGYGEAEAKDAADRAQALGYLDDGRLARRLAREALDDGWAGEALLARLTTKGLDEALARSAVREAMEASGWSPRDAAAHLAASRKLSGTKAARFLASRGFEEDVISRLLGLPDKADLSDWK